MAESQEREARRHFSHWAGAVSVLALMAALPAPAMAQNADPAADETQATEEEDIVIVGLRRGLQDSISARRDASSLVEVVSAEDIGKLPDVSIAESLARLPGLAGQRVNGRAQVISIRGLAPDFTTTLLNGRQQASSGDNRAVEFDQYPSELLSSVVVYKTPDATISGFGLSGTADLRTVRPLTFGERAAAVNVRAEFTDGPQLNDEVDRYGNRISLSYIDQFANDTIGVAVGFAHLDSPTQNQHFKAYSYEAFGFAVTPDSADSALQLNGQEAFAYSRENIRDAAIAIIEWEPNAQWHNTLDLYYSTFSQDEIMRGAQWFSNGWADGATFTNVQTTPLGGSTFGTSGHFNNAVPIIRNDWNTRDDELFAAGLNTEYQVTDAIQISGDLSYSRNVRDEQVLETYAGYGVGPLGTRTLDSYDFEIPLDGYPTYSGFGLNYADATQVSLGDRAPWGGWGHDGTIRFPHVEEEITALNVAARFDLDTPIFNQIDIGLNYTMRDKSKTVDEYDLNLNGVGRPQTLVASQYLVPSTSLDFVGFGEVLSVDLPSALGVYYTRSPIRDASYYNKSWDLEENITTLYGRASFEGGPWHGNVGIQFVAQEQTSNGTALQDDFTLPGTQIVPVPFSAGTDYLDILPSMNIIRELGGGHRLRFAAAYTMARPRVDEMRANMSAGFAYDPSSPPVPGTTIHPWSASGGNPNLEPWRAAAYDLSYEWYIDATSYFSVAFFYKNLDSYIYQQTVPFDFSGMPIPSTLTIPAGVIVDPMGTLTSPANGSGGLIRGVEISGAFNFGLLHDSLEGLGLIGSYSESNSDLNAGNCLNPTCTTRQEARIPGLSAQVYSITGYFERGGFQARASYRYRSPFKGDVVQLFANRGYTEIMEDEQVDAQIGYTFQDGTALEGLGILLQVNNLTNSPYQTRLGLDAGGVHSADGSSLPEVYEEYGRQFLLGLNYRF